MNVGIKSGEGSVALTRIPRFGELGVHRLVVRLLYLSRRR
jgi:hypothetical protein